MIHRGAWLKLRSTSVDVVEIPGFGIRGFTTSFNLKSRTKTTTFWRLMASKRAMFWLLEMGCLTRILGILLEIAPQIERPIVFAGVSEQNRQYWESRHSGIRAKWIRHVEEQHLPALLRGAFCLVQPSLIEGYGYPPLEAMACGMPAIVSHIPVLLETTGNCALSAPPDDPSAWRNALRTLENSSRYGEFVEKGLKWTQPLARPQERGNLILKTSKI